jgi:hypothetical protein
MAVVKGMQKIVGGFANASFYTIQGSEEVYVRIKGGPSKRAIKTKPQFEKLRRNNNEWKACTKMGSNIRQGYYRLNCLEDFPAIGTLNGVAKKLQLLDTEAEHGKRGIYLSKHKDAILGFNMSRKQVFESVLRVPLETDLNRETMTANVSLPAIDTRMYLYNFRNLPFFRLYFQLCGIADIVYSEERKVYYETSNVYAKGESEVVTDWLSTNGQTEALNLTLTYSQEELPVPESVTLVLSVGLEFGKQGSDGKPEAVKYAGTGKIVRVG